MKILQESKHIYILNKSRLLVEKLRIKLKRNENNNKTPNTNNVDDFLKWYIHVYALKNKISHIFPLSQTSTHILFEFNALCVIVLSYKFVYGYLLITNSCIN